jgi:hypothetical protein
MQFFILRSRPGILRSNQNPSVQFARKHSEPIRFWAGELPVQLPRAPAAGGGAGRGRGRGRAPGRLGRGHQGRARGRGGRAGRPVHPPAAANDEQLDGDEADEADDAAADSDLVLVMLEAMRHGEADSDDDHEGGGEIDGLSDRTVRNLIV